MKNYLQISFLILKLFLLIACQRPSDNPQQIPTSEIINSTGEIKNLTEYEIQGLTEATTVRVSKLSSSFIVSIKTTINNTTNYKTLIAEELNGKRNIQVTNLAYLFND